MLLSDFKNNTVSVETVLFYIIFKKIPVELMG